jgi:hypothetical protein
LVILGLLLLLCFLWFFRKPTKYVHFEAISGEDLEEPLREADFSDGTKRKYEI